MYRYGATLSDTMIAVRPHPYEEKALAQYRLAELTKSLPATVPFVGPETQERARGGPFDARIGANESVFGPSPKVVAAIAEAASAAWMYGDPEIHTLHQAIAAHHGVEPGNIMVGEGIDGLLGYVVRMFVEPGDSVVTSQGAYPTFNYHVVGYDGQLVTVPYCDDREDGDALLAAAAECQAKLIYLANPDNPMGTWWGAEKVDDIISRVPAGALLVLDEAYGEFAEPGTLPEIDVSSDRVLRFRTFSKAYGLAGIRLGYVIGNADLVAEFNKVRNHFGVGRVVQAAGLAALADQSHLAWVIDQVKAARRRIVEIASDNGLTTVDSATNFVAIDCGRDGDFATRVLNSLVERGIFVRMPGVPPLNRCIRITAGLDHELDAFAAALPLSLADAN